MNKISFQKLFKLFILMALLSAGFYSFFTDYEVIGMLLFLFPALMFFVILILVIIPSFFTWLFSIKSDDYDLCALCKRLFSAFCKTFIFDEKKEELEDKFLLESKEEVEQLLRNCK